jgi:hypothetical protein
MALTPACLRLSLILAKLLLVRSLRTILMSRKYGASHDFDKVPCLVNTVHLMTLTKSLVLILTVLVLTGHMALNLLVMLVLLFQGYPALR